MSDNLWDATIEHAAYRLARLYGVPRHQVLYMGAADNPHRWEVLCAICAQRERVASYAQEVLGPPTWTVGVTLLSMLVVKHQFSHFTALAGQCETCQQVYFVTAQGGHP